MATFGSRSLNWRAKQMGEKETEKNRKRRRDDLHVFSLTPQRGPPIVYELL